MAIDRAPMSDAAMGGGTVCADHAAAQELRHRADQIEQDVIPESKTAPAPRRVRSDRVCSNAHLDAAARDLRAQHLGARTRDHARYIFFGAGLHQEDDTPRRPRPPQALAPMLPARRVAEEPAGR